MRPELDSLMLAVANHAASPALFLGAVPHPDLPAHTIGWQPHKPLADAWDAAGFQRVDHLPHDSQWPLVLVLPGKSSDETRLWFALARDRLSPGGRLLVSMPNTAGAARFEKELAKATGSVESIQKFKCRAFSAVHTSNWNESQFTTWRQLGDAKSIANTHYQTQAGIFSSDHIDPGSQFLIDHLPKSIHGHVADLGAGWGFLSDQLLHRCPHVESIDLYEADARALDCARYNLTHHNQRTMAYHWHDVRRPLQREYHAIIMNPPFHSGQATDIDLGRAFLTTAHQSLRHNGDLFLVANRHLPYESHLDHLGFRWRCTAENATFKLLFARKG